MAAKVTGVPAVNSVRRIRRIDVLDRDDQKNSYANAKKQSSKSFKAVLNEKIADTSCRDKDTASICIKI